MKAPRFLLPAEIEMAEAAVFYETQVESLGLNFLTIVEAAVYGIVDQPDMWPDIGHGIRKRPLRRFPYSILYRLDGDEIIIVAVMHQRRRPSYWLGRV
ncbi:MAG: type II toxin-antitoxin system RelE/ParE family toxin [Desulfobulbaceae bacterium]|nr:type II toxin-antitoxin system RelE/ParE family toxin [Desulfobulbaceae bacterium]